MKKSKIITYALTSAISFVCLTSKDSLHAQIVPDTNLPVNSSHRVSGNTEIIEGGTQVQGNLFHSFLKFSVPTGSAVFFNNDLTVKNIISRVTGLAISEIDGLIQANGDANLFLINPNGIIFGPNSSLDIGGSFVSSTANSVQFADGTEFSATTPSASPLLTVTAPIGLQFRGNSGAISIQGKGHNLEIIEPFIFFSIKRDDNDIGLSVKSGKTLAIVGGNVNIDGGNLIAENGQIELGGVNTGLVSLNPTVAGWTLGYEGVESFQDIGLTQKASVDASGINGGSIHVQGARVKLNGGSVILTENQGSQSGGNITVNASESLELSESSETLLENIAPFPTLIFTQATGQGKGGDITVSTQQLIMRGGANIDALTLNGGAKGGNITIAASDSIQLIGEESNGSIIARTQNSGDAGNIFISTNDLTILNGSNIIAPSNFGAGNAGNVKVDSFTIKLVGFNQLALLPSLIASASATANAGNVEINSSRVTLQDGGQIGSSTLGSGSAGSVIINATDFIELSGTIPGSVNPTQVISSANKVDELQQFLFGLPPVPSGASGNVKIVTSRLSISDGAQVTVRNDGTGMAGDLSINADSIVLNNKGGITASTLSGEGGNIFLSVRDVLQLSNDSFISATAGGTGNGGNIDVTAKFLIAFLSLGSNGSDIIANAVSGSGGNIKINSMGLFGIEPRKAIPGNQTNDIDASSQFGQSGQVQINTTTDPNQGLVELPTTVVDPSTLVAQNPCKRSSSSEFIRSGRGGLPPSLSQDLNGESTQVGLVEPTNLSATTPEPKPNSKQAGVLPQSSSQIAPAQGWVYNDKGEVVLVAYNSAVTGPQRLQSNPKGCPVL
jgi:filamentous hemagglutinin family protein